MGKTKVLCTGGRGFIGRHLVRRLVEKGEDVWCLLGPGDEPDPSAAGNIRWIHGDVTDPRTLELASGPFSVVYHLAGLNSAPDPSHLYKVNYEGTVNVAAAVLSGGHRPDKLLYASSYAAMGPAVDPAGLSEASPCCPVSDYGKSKLMAEHHLMSLKGILPVTVVRLPLVYGPGSKGGLYTYFKLIRKGLCPCLAGGEATLGFVEDMVEGIVMAAETPGTDGATFLLGDDRATPLEEILASIESALGRKALRIRLPVWSILLYGLLSEKMAALRGKDGTRFRQNFEGFVRYPSWRGNVARARERLGFSARVSFAEGARITADWYRRNGLI
jgi:nucleoside-diphosphate-sugar epimerase